MKEAKGRDKMTRTVHHIVQSLHEWAPPKTKMDYDNVGLLVGSSQQSVQNILVCLDVTEQIVDEAIAKNCDLIVAHHPLIFKKLAQIQPDKGHGSIIYKLIKHDIAVFASHTNLDAAYNGVSYQLAQTIGLQQVEFLDPYENQENAGMGAIGDLEAPCNKEQFLAHLADALQTESIRYSGSVDSLARIAVCGGAGVFLKEQAQRAGADAFVTADVKYHDYFNKTDNFLLVDVGHFESEYPIITEIKKYLLNFDPELNVLIADTYTNPMRVYNPHKNQSTYNTSNT